MYTWGEHASSTQKGSSQDLNQEPTCCDATVLTTTPRAALMMLMRYNIYTTFTISVWQVCMVTFADQCLVCGVENFRILI